MLLKYTNRKGSDHYLRAAQTKKGKARYYIVKNLEKFSKSELLKEMPKGYEFYEDPDDARVCIRKIITPLFSIEEKKIVDEFMKKHDFIKDYIIELEKEVLTIYTAHMTKDEFPTLSNEFLILNQSYNPQLVFAKKEGNYIVHRRCHLGRYPDWIPLETNSKLDVLAKKFTFHIGKESLLKFWIEGEEDW